MHEQLFSDCTRPHNNQTTVKDNNASGYTIPLIKCVIIICNRGACNVEVSVLRRKMNLISHFHTSWIKFGGNSATPLFRREKYGGGGMTRSPERMGGEGGGVGDPLRFHLPLRLRKLIPLYSPILVAQANILVSELVFIACQYSDKFQLGLGGRLKICTQTKQIYQTTLSLIH